MSKAIKTTYHNTDLNVVLVFLNIEVGIYRNIRNSSSHLFHRNYLAKFIEISFAKDFLIDL